MGELNDLRNESCLLSQRKVEEVLEKLSDLRRHRSNREKAIALWESKVHAFVSWAAQSLKNKTEAVYQHHFKAFTKKQERLQNLNKDLLALFLLESRDKKIFDEKIEEMQQIQWEDDYNGDFEFLQISTSGAKPEIVRGYLESHPDEDLSYMRAVLFDVPPASPPKKAESPAGAFKTPQSPSGLMHVEDSFYANPKKKLGIHFLDENEDTILNAGKGNFNELNKSDMRLMKADEKDGKATCHYCHQPMSVVLQLNLAKNNIFNGLGNTTPNICNTKQINRDGSKRKILSFDKKTTILEEECLNGITTPKITDGHLKSEEKIDRKSLKSRSDLNLSKSDDEDEDEIDKKFSPPKIAKIIHPLIEATPKKIAVMKFKYEGFCPTSIAKIDKNLFACSPTLGKVVVMDLLNFTEVGYLKIPNEAFNRPRNVLAFRDRVLVLDNHGINKFNKTGEFEATVFGKGISNEWRGLADFNNEILTLERDPAKQELYLLVLDIETESVVKRILIKEAKSDYAKTMCRFLSCHESNVIITDMQSGRIFKVDLSSGQTGELNHDIIGRGTGVTFHECGRFAVADIDRKTIQVFEKDGTWIKKLEFPNLITPTGILLDNSSLYVADSAHVIFKFSMV